MKFTINAKMWYSGIAVTTTSWPGRIAFGATALYCSVLATRLRCDSAAPLDSPVVPPVYCRNSRSSPSSSTGVRGIAAPIASASAKVMLNSSRGSTGGLGSVRLVQSLGVTVITVLMPVRAMTSASAGVEPLKITMILLPESLS